MDRKATINQLATKMYCAISIVLIISTCCAQNYEKEIKVKYCNNIDKYKIKKSDELLANVNTLIISIIKKDVNGIINLLIVNKDIEIIEDNYVPLSIIKNELNNSKGRFYSELFDTTKYQEQNYDFLKQFKGISGYEDRMLSIRDVLIGALKKNICIRLTHPYSESDNTYWVNFIWDNKSSNSYVFPFIYINGSWKLFSINFRK